MNLDQLAPTEHPLPDLTVAMVQTELLWERSTDNCQHLTELLHQQTINVDLVVLPEVFNSGFSMNVRDTAQTMQGPAIEWMRESAASLNAALCGSLAINEHDKVFNRLIMACPDGSLHSYDKRHLFRMGGENERYTQGQQRCVWHWRGWRLCPMICYDLRFPVWSRNHDDFDALVYAANWPAVRRDHWRQLLQARAIENQCAVIGVNRLGVDGRGIAYCGDSMAIDAQGHLLCDPGAIEGLHQCRIEGSAQRRYRASFPAALDADAFSLMT